MHSVHNYHMTDPVEKLSPYFYFHFLIPWIDGIRANKSPKGLHVTAKKLLMVCF